MEVNVWLPYINSISEPIVWFKKLYKKHFETSTGLFEYSHMEFNVERGAVADAEEGAAAGAAVKADDPSLADMTRAALSILLKNEKGFFLLIEG